MANEAMNPANVLVVVKDSNKTKQPTKVDMPHNTLALRRDDPTLSSTIPPATEPITPVRHGNINVSAVGRGNQSLGSCTTEAAIHESKIEYGYLFPVFPAQPSPAAQLDISVQSLEINPFTHQTNSIHPTAVSISPSLVPVAPPTCDNCDTSKHQVGLVTPTVSWEEERLASLGTPICIHTQHGHIQCVCAADHNPHALAHHQAHVRAKVAQVL